LARHFAGSATGEAKFAVALTSDEGKELVAAVDRYLRAHLEAAEARGEKPSKLEVTLGVADLPIDAMSAGGKAFLAREVLGTDSLLSQGAEGAFKGLRDGRFEVNYVVRPELPGTNRMTIVAGPYGPSGLWGFYTFHPGELAPEMPSPRLTGEALTASQAFWSKAALVITPDETRALIDRYDPLIKDACERENAYQDSMLVHGRKSAEIGMKQATEDRYRYYDYKHGAEAALAAASGPGRPMPKAPEAPQERPRR
jgi:hypothetical protein